ncbi:MAG: DMT family transporter [Candidatus Bipolaricaulota bacterium]|nr:DMT family transporter [Candidatus Bipolaricaulota bacterium]
MIATHWGEIAALGTAVLWTMTYLQFTVAVRRIGASLLNRTRLTVALAFLVLAHLIVHGTPFPLDAEAARWGWLILSGVIGFAISDALLFRSLLHLGAHRTALLMALIPVASALFAWGTLGEELTAIQAVAALVTVSGIVLVISTRSSDREAANTSRRTSFGILCALGAVVAQSLRYILSKQGMSGGFPILSTNVMQILAATVAVWIVAAFRGTIRGSLAPLRERTAVLSTVGGAFTGPFLGVSLSLVALSAAPVGIASTLMALMPVFLLPVSRFAFKERITLRATIGTALAVGGVAVLLLVRTP